MSKIDKITIQVGEEIIEVPAWATETTAKKLAKHSEATAKAVTELLRMQNKTNKVANSNKELFKQIEQGIDNQVYHSKKIQKKQDETKKESNKSAKTQSDTAKKLNEASKGLVSSVAKGDLKSIAVAAGSIIGLSNAFGFAAGLVEEFSQNLVKLTNTGVGFGTSLENLRSEAAAAGLDLENYGKVVSTNSEAINALGDSTSEGARNFSRLSGELRVAAREFNQFGLSNREYNEILAEEIELRRRSGQEAREIQASLTESMNDLMLETTQMAAMTGQDRREMLRNRQQMLQQPVIEAFRMRLEKDGEHVSDNLGHVASVLGRGGDTGLQFAQAMTEAIALNQDIATVQQGMFAELSALGGENLNRNFREIFEFVKNNYADMPTEEFTRTLTSMSASIAESVTSDDLENLSRLSSAGNQTAGQLITLIGELQGLSTSVDTNKKSQEEAEKHLRDTPFLALASSLEDLANNIQASALDQVFGLFGDDFRESGEIIIDSFRSMADAFRDGNLVDGVVNMAKKAPGEMQLAAGATAATAAGYGVYKIASRPKNVIPPANTAAKAAGTTATGKLLSKVPSSVGRTTQTAGRVLGGTARMGARALPFVGSALMGMSAFDRFKEGEYGRGAMESVGAIASLFPGLGTMIGLGLYGGSTAMGFAGDDSASGVQNQPTLAGPGSSVSSLLEGPLAQQTETAEQTSPQNTGNQTNQELLQAIRVLISQMGDANRMARRRNELLEDLE